MCAASKRCACVDHDVDPAPNEIFDHAWYDDWGVQQSTAVFVRAGERSVFACVANPFGRTVVDGAHLRMSYRPGLTVDGTFVSDRFVLGSYVPEGREIRREVVEGRDTVRGVPSSYVKLLGRGVPVVLDAAEVRAVRDAVSARVPWEPARMQVSHWDWGENLYRQNPADPGTQATYERLAQLCETIGVETLLLCPGSRWSEYEDLNAEAGETGPWQNGMWLATGIEVGSGAWSPADELPPGVTEIVGSAARARAEGRGVRQPAVPLAAQPGVAGDPARGRVPRRGIQDLLPRACAGA